jgi:hypothetical protein
VVHAKKNFDDKIIREIEYKLIAAAVKHQEKM